MGHCRMPEKMQKYSSGYRTLENGQPPIFLYFCEGRILTRLYFTTHTCCFLVNDSEGKKGNTDSYSSVWLQFYNPIPRRTHWTIRVPQESTWLKQMGGWEIWHVDSNRTLFARLVVPFSLSWVGGIHDSRREMDKSIDLRGHLQTLRLSLDFWGGGGRDSILFGCPNFCSHISAEQVGKSAQHLVVWKFTLFGSYGVFF